MQIHNLRQALLNKNPESDTEPQFYSAEPFKLKDDVRSQMLNLLSGMQDVKTGSNEIVDWKPQFFDFGFMDWEQVHEESMVAVEPFYEKFLHLPAPISVFECQTFDASGGMLKIVLWLAQIPINSMVSGTASQLPWTVRDEANGIFALEFIDIEQFKAWTTNGWVIEFPRDAESLAKYHLKNDVDMVLRKDWLKLHHLQNNQTESFTSKHYAEALQQGREACINLAKIPDSKKEITMDWGEVGLRMYHFMLCALGRLDSKGIEREYIEAPDRLNKSRVRKGKEPLVSHTVVKVAPVRETLGHSGPREEYTPKRYHFRRGHVRRFKNGQKTWVRGCFVGSPEAGSVTHDYRVAA